MSDLSSLIAQAIAKKKGDKEFALFYLVDKWSADIGNDCHSVILGEIGGEFSADGATAEEAVLNLLKAMDKA